MKKSLILVGMLSIGYAYAQEGSVGINTETPKATLEILPSAKNLEGTTNEGIIIPKLTKARVLAIATDKLVEGTKVYITDEVLASDNAKFQGTGKGFYFYNGTKWVKQLASDNDTNSELWAQRDNAGVTETYLKPANEKEDFVGYNSNRHFKLNLGKTDETVFAPTVSPFSVYVSSDVLPNPTTTQDSSRFILHSNNSLLKEAHVSKYPKSAYYGLGSLVRASDIKTPFHEMTGTILQAEYLSTGKVNNLVGSYISADLGNNTIKSAANAVSGLVVTSRNFGTTNDLRGVTFYTENHETATVSNINGIRNFVASNQSDKTQHNVNNVRGIENRTTLQKQGTVGTIDGIANVMTVSENSTITNELKGIFNYIGVNANTTNPNLVLSQDQVNVPATASITRLVGYNFMPQIRAGATVNELIGLHSNMAIADAKATVENAYGLKISDVNAGTDKYAIHTGKGTVSLGDRLHIRVNNDVNLTTEIPSFMIGNTTSPNLIMDANEIQARDNGNAAELFLQTDGGTLSINNNVAGQSFIFSEGKLGIDVNRSNLTEKLEVNGNVKVIGLKGTGTRNVVADENGVLRVGDATGGAAGATTVGSTDGIVCNADNVGKINYGDITLSDGRKVGAFGFCMKGTDASNTPTYGWKYLYGIEGVTSGSGAFGSGIQ